MKSLILLLTFCFITFANNEQACLNDLQSKLTSPINSTVHSLSENQSVWIQNNKVILQAEQRAYIFQANLSEGLNYISLANNKGKELANICIQKVGKLQYIESVGEKCDRVLSSNFNQSIAYAKKSFESSDLISYQIYSKLKTFYQALDKNINRHRCQDYMQSFSRCFKSFNQLTGEGRIPATENSLQFILKEIRKKLIYGCRPA